MKTLECSSAGEKRFSAFYAKVDVFGKFASIEEHYQESKRFMIEGTLVALPLKEAKGKTPHLFQVGEQLFHVKHLSAYYQVLWMKYLDHNPALVTYASAFDEFTDRFRGKAVNCQADVIRMYVKEGRSTLMKSTRAFRELIGVSHYVKKGDLFMSNEAIYAHQTNCQGKMGRGIAVIVKNKYPEAFSEYKSLCFVARSPEALLGYAQMVESNGKVIANLFGQLTTGYGQMTDYDALEKAFTALKAYAIEFGYDIAMPYGIGCGFGGGKWEEVVKRVNRVFSDYPVLFYARN